MVLGDRCDGPCKGTDSYEALDGSGEYEYSHLGDLIGSANKKSDAGGGADPTAPGESSGESSPTTEGEGSLIGLGTTRIGSDDPVEDVALFVAGLASQFASDELLGALDPALDDQSAHYRSVAYDFGRLAGAGASTGLALYEIYVGAMIGAGGSALGIAGAAPTGGATLGAIPVVSTTSLLLIGHGTGILGSRLARGMPDIPNYSMAESTGIPGGSTGQGVPSYIPKDSNGSPLSIPRDANGRLVPSSDAPHTQIGHQQGRRGDYVQTVEFGEGGVPVKRVDWTDHGRPKDHTNPHVHDYSPNETGGSFKEGKARPPNPGEF